MHNINNSPATADRFGVVSGSGSDGLVISAETRQLFADPVAVEIPASLTPDLVFPSADLVTAAAGMFPGVLSPALRLGVYVDKDLPGFVRTRGRMAAEGVWPRVEISAGVVRLTRVDLAAAERRLSRASDIRAEGVPSVPLWCTCGRCSVVPDAVVADLVWWGAEVPSCPGVQGPDSRPMVFSPDVVPTSAGLVTSWSRKSRANLRYRILTLDLAAFVARGRPGIVTLTLPGDWLAIAPTAAAASLVFDNFCRAWAHRWGEPLACVWKREFQRRGAPHWHLWCIPPSGLEFRRWVSLAWAEAMFLPTVGDAGELPHGGSDRPAWGEPVVGFGPGRRRSEWCKCSEWCRSLQAGTGVDYAEGMRASDPHRLATYFLKESGTAESKAYQNEAPSEWAGGSVGRFWGVRKLKPFVASVEISPEASVKLWRAMRKVSERQFARRTVVRVVPFVGLPARADLATGELLDPVPGGYRKRRPVARAFRVRGSAGWVAVNNGAAFGESLGRLASALAAPPSAVLGFAERVAAYKSRSNVVSNVV